VMKGGDEEPATKRTLPRVRLLARENTALIWIRTHGRTMSVSLRSDSEISGVDKIIESVLGDLQDSRAFCYVLIC
jgi:hypothetical protein